MATPSNKRHRDVYGGLPRFPRSNVAALPELAEVPPSSVSCVPSSSRKAQQSPFLGPDSTGNSGRSALPIAETPTRGPSKPRACPPTSTMATVSHADISQSSPPSAAPKIPKATNDLFNSTRWALHVEETPSKARYSYQVENSGGTTTDATSVTASSAVGNPMETMREIAPSPLSQDKEESIYAALGWDDVDELL